LFFCFFDFCLPGGSFRLPPPYFRWSGWVS
jgi:hypothetical protein